MAEVSFLPSANTRNRASASRERAAKPRPITIGTGSHVGIEMETHATLSHGKNGMDHAHAREYYGSIMPGTIN